MSLGWFYDVESNPNAWATEKLQAASISMIIFEKPLLNLPMTDLSQATNSSLQIYGLNHRSTIETHYMHT